MLAFCITIGAAIVGTYCAIPSELNFVTERVRQQKHGLENRRV